MNFQEENAMDVAGKIEQSLCAILPIGAVEAHGPHLPLGTDNLLAERLARLLADRTNSFVLPTLPMGKCGASRTSPAASMSLMKR